MNCGIIMITFYEDTTYNFMAQHFSSINAIISLNIASILLAIS